jgi:hypothetical protein
MDNTSKFIKHSNSWSVWYSLMHCAHNKTAHQGFWVGIENVTADDT